MGVESGALPDTALSASSSYDPLNVGPQHARLGQVNRGPGTKKGQYISANHFTLLIYTNMFKHFSRKKYFT